MEEDQRIALVRIPERRVQCDEVLVGGAVYDASGTPLVPRMAAKGATMLDSLDAQSLAFHNKVVYDWLNEKTITPITVEVSLTTRCNLHCNFCAFDYRADGESLSHDDLKRLTCHLSPTKAVHIAGEGEPTLSANLNPFVRMLSDRAIKIGMTTNGVFFNDVETAVVRLTWLRFSVNAGTSTTYEEIHGADCFNAVLQHIEEAVRVKHDQGTNCTIGVQFLALPENLSEVLVLAQQVKEIGVDYFVVKPFSAHPQSEHMVDADYDLEQLEADHKELQAMSTYRFGAQVRLNAFRDTKTSKAYKGCVAAPFFAFIAASGDVYPCAMFVGDKEFSMGNIRYQTWEEVITCYKRKMLLSRLRHNWDTDNCRHPCRLHQANRYLHRVWSPHNHDAFI